MNGILFNFYLIIVLAIIGGIVGYKRRSYGETLDQILSYLVWGVGVGIILSGIIFSIDSESGEEYTKHDIYIYSLRNNNEMTGDFFLGSGSIENVEYYYVYYKSIYGFERAKYKVSQVSIVETDTRRPEIVERWVERKGNWFTWYDDNTGGYIMYVPKNTIIRQFKAY